MVETESSNVRPCDGRSNAKCLRSVSRQEPRPKTVKQLAGMLLIPELQLSFQRSGASSAGRNAAREKGLRIRGCGEYHPGPGTARNEFQSEPEPADRLGTVVLHILVATAEERDRQPDIAVEEERRRDEQTGAEEVKERQRSSSSSARTYSQRVVSLVYL